MALINIMTIVKNSYTIYRDYTQSKQGPVQNVPALLLLLLEEIGLYAFNLNSNYLSF